MNEHKHTSHNHVPETASQLSLAHSATWHCLMGCGLGEVVGVIIGTALELPIVQTMVLVIEQQRSLSENLDVVFLLDPNHALI